MGVDIVLMVPVVVVWFVEVAVRRVWGGGHCVRAAHSNAFPRAPHSKINKCAYADHMCAGVCSIKRK